MRSVIMSLIVCENPGLFIESTNFLLAFETDRRWSKQLIDVHVKMLVKGLDLVVDRSLAETACGM